MIDIILGIINITNVRFALYLQHIFECGNNILVTQNTTSWVLFGFTLIAINVAQLIVEFMATNIRQVKTDRIEIHLFKQASGAFKSWRVTRPQLSKNFN